MEFSLPLFLVVPSANSIPTTGSTYDLTAGQTGIFKQDYTAATAANIATSQYIYITQGRADRTMPSLRSDKIDKNLVVEWSKAQGSAVAANQITEIGDFNVKCGESLTVSFRLHSSYIETIFYNGLTRSVTVQAPCCDCGADPCTEVEVETLVDLLIAELNKDFNSGREATNLKTFLIFEKQGSGASTKLRVIGKPLTKYGQPCDLAANPYLYDRMWFQSFVVKGTETTSDFFVFDKCDPAGDVTILQRSTYPRFTSDEVAQLEKDNYSYKVARFKELYRRPGWNIGFESYVEAGVVYNQYLIQVKQKDQNNSYTDVSEQDFRVIMMVPNTITNIETVLTAYLGAPADIDSVNASTTTTTSTTSTSTTSTTTEIQIP